MTYRDWDKAHKAQSQVNYLHRWQKAVGALARAQYENRIHTECLALAVEALGQIGGLANEALVRGILAEIETRLMELKSKAEEKTE